MDYQVKLTYDGTEYLVTCDDLPEFATVGDTEEEALREAVDGIETTLQAYIQDRRPIPAPSKGKRGTHPVRLSAGAVAKLGLYQAMLEKNMRKADLARKLGLHMPQVDRLLDLRHSTKLEQLEIALDALGRRMQVTVQEEAA